MTIIKAGSSSHPVSKPDGSCGNRIRALSGSIQMDIDQLYQGECLLIANMCGFVSRVSSAVAYLRARTKCISPGRIPCHNVHCRSECFRRETRCSYLTRSPPVPYWQPPSCCPQRLLVLSQARARGQVRARGKVMARRRPQKCSSFLWSVADTVMNGGTVVETHDYTVRT